MFFGYYNTTKIDEHVRNESVAVTVVIARKGTEGNDSNLLIVFYVQIMPDDFVMQLHRF